MQVRIEEQSSIAKRVTVTVPVDQVAREFAGAYNRLSQRVNLPGFRRGKVPVEVLRKRYGMQISVDVAQSLVDAGWKHVLKEHKLLPITQPRFEGQLEPAAPGAEFSYSFVVEIPPEVDLLPYNTIAVDKTDWTIADGHVEHELTHVADGAATWAPVGDRDVSQSGDMVVVDFEGKLDGVLFEGGKAEDYEIVLGSNRLIPGFEDQLTGQKVDQDFDVSVTFPEAYPNKDLAGKAAVFTSKIKDIKVRIVPAIDDELAATLGVENLEKLRTEVRTRMAAQWDRSAKNEAFGAIQAHIAETYKFELPPSLIEAELKARKQEVESEIEADAPDREARLAAASEGARKNVEDSLRVAFVLDAVGEKENVDVAEAEISREIELMVRQAGAYGSRVRQMYREAEQRTALKRRLRHLKVLDFLLTQANVTLVSKEIPAHEHGEETHAHD